VGQALALAGIGEEEGADARSLAQAEAVGAALRFAKRRSIGPYSAKPHDLRERERAIAALVRAGHRFALARAIVAMEPGSDADVDKLSESY
jgi:regulatory protein